MRHQCDIPAKADPGNDRFWPVLLVSEVLSARPLLSAFLPRALHNGISLIDPVRTFPELAVAFPHVRAEGGRMDWNAIGAIGESLGAIAVFITLVYLAIQVRSTRADVQRGVMQGRLQAARELTMAA
jgi:hypothetical protein